MSVDTAKPDFAPDDLPPATLLVCLTCRQAGVPPTSDDQRPGAVLMQALAVRYLPAGVRLRGVECLSNCSRGCTVALSGAGRWSYVIGTVDPAQHVDALLEGVALYQASADGIVPWRARPEIIRKGVIARIPAMEV